MRNQRYEKMVLRSYGISTDEYPKIYLYNQKISKLMNFDLNPNLKNGCIILQNLIKFVADGDCGLISYLNHLHDPFLGVKFKHNSRLNRWEENDKGKNVAGGGTSMCNICRSSWLFRSYRCIIN